MKSKVSVHVDLPKSDNEFDEIVNNCRPTLDKIAKEAANNYEKQLLQFAIRNKAKQVYVVRKIKINVEDSCWEIDCQFFTDKEVACTYAKMNKLSYTCEIIGHELWQLTNISDDVFAQSPDDGNKELAAEYRRVMREE